MQRGDRFRCVEIVRERIENVGAERGPSAGIALSSSYH